MTGAREATASKVVVDADGIAAVMEYVDIKGIPLQYSKATKTSMGLDLTTADPYEKKWVICRESDVSGMNTFKIL